ncbi:MAG: sugar phosphorylase, partial [Chloroflexi bacterium]|nr:sugar phosphorylase [Chloroflexota bacterium]
MTNELLTEHLAFLYGIDKAEELTLRLLQILDAYKAGLGEEKRPFPTPNLTEKDAVLITYGDMVQEYGAAPLHILSQFLKKTVADAISTVHILPFYPYSSDDGFSVIDYEAVNPALGNWDNIAEIGHDFRLMFDAVINHISAKSDWFQRFLDGDEQVADYFITVEPDTDLSAVFRPRALPLLTAFETANGDKHVWTTFSTDQIDLNFSHPDLLLDVLQIMLGYVARGAELIRLDAVGFIWKEVGTRCLHLPQAHRIIQLMRSVLDRVAPHVILITET